MNEEVVETTNLPESFRWPDGKRIAVIFRCAFEGWADDKWPGIGPMGNPIKAGVLDTNAVSFAEYGPKRGIQRILKVADKLDIRLTIMINGIMAARHPDIVKEIHDKGHDIVAHSYSMDVVPAYLSEEEERANIRKAVGAIETVTGKRPEGWISPRGTPSLNTGRLLVEEGLKWHGDPLDDDLPYFVNYKSGKLLVFPSNMDINDLPIYMKHGQTPDAMIKIFDQWLEYVRKYEDGAVRIDPTIHSHVFGRALGMSAYAKLIEKAKAEDDIWIGTRAEAVSHILTNYAD